LSSSVVGSTHTVDDVGNTILLLRSIYWCCRGFSTGVAEAVDLVEDNVI